MLLCLVIKIGDPLHNNNFWHFSIVVMIVTRKKAFVNKAVLQGKKMTNVPALYELGLLLLV